MRYITKTKEPDAFSKWKEQESKTLEKYYENDSIKAGKIWGYLDSKEEALDKRKDGIAYYSKAELRNSLVDEQGGICCYCGQKLKKDSTTKLEHLEAKSLDKRTTFQYKNIYASCEGGNTTKYTVKKDGELIGDIAVTVRVDVNTLMALNADTIFQLLKKGDEIIYQVLNKHCDAKKDKFPIFIKPNQSDCEEKFIYDKLGEIKPINEDVNNDIINTINQLGLNENKRLKDIRAKAWERATERLEILQIAAGDDLILFKQLMEKVYKSRNKFNEKGLLTECCFIERFVLKKFGNF